MITALLTALVLIAIVGVIAWGVMALIPLPAPVKIVIQVIAAILCLLILLRAIQGAPLLG